ncbi:GNAT family N-acetyltransferase [Luteolibacter sp. GHJ8]|uniref:GNAT family N-acetyltransferase n=1 Tax=Luteolibacter rhizosphaerae TaxID=2989719 RepID=A0ABT3G512_9BACT|nr:GNAT family N-acetyltransferase [Luteolibacter rhizosphaerae]MCW1914910.1 GNAT family N-acetyltransferase [Luteolibacter rhizosphaerae]
MTAAPLLFSPHPDDREAFIRLFTDPELRRYLGGPLSLPQAELRADSIIVGEEAGLSVIRPAPDHEAIGLIWLSPYHDSVETELSFVLLPDWQGRGFAFRAASEALMIGFRDLDLPRIVSETQAANVASIALLKRLGMRLERRLERFGAEQLLFAISR